jgi:hypothetical protein
MMPLPAGPVKNDDVLGEAEPATAHVSRPTTATTSERLSLGATMRRGAAAILALDCVR